MDIEELCKISSIIIDPKDNDKLILITKQLFNDQNIQNITSKEVLRKSLDKLSRENKIIPSMVKILFIYRSLASAGELKYDPKIEKYLRTKNVRSLSGIVNITVFTSPYPETSKGVQEFSCEYNCHYCPKEPNQPRSYLLKEPAVLRANANKFISTEQFWDRALTLIRMGHPLDKIELIVSGGTFSSYPIEYTTNFMRDQFYAANVAYDKFNGIKLREPLTLSDEQDLNQNQALIKIIGITIETRPDRIKKQDLIYFRELGVTRVQMGVQHTNDKILDHINRKCSNIHTIRGIKALKESGFKVDIHLMPDLPPPDGITREDMIKIDHEMFEQVIEQPEYQADQWKIYPCETVPWTEIEKWYNEGIYKPYAELTNSDGTNPLFELLIDVKSKVKPWVRLNRVIRDIPNSYIIGGNSNTSMRNDLLSYMKKKNIKCNCIRCREVKDKDIKLDDFELKVRSYDASDGIEYFISWEDSEDTLLGFLRLRINESSDNKYFPELSNCALIRELHVYGQVITHDNINNGDGVQHRGLGKALLAKATEIAGRHGYNKLSVISGVGVRNYYIKQGFKPVDSYIDDSGMEIKTKGHFLILDMQSKTSSTLTKVFENLQNVEINNLSYRNQILNMCLIMTVTLGIYKLVSKSF